MELSRTAQRTFRIVFADDEPFNHKCFEALIKTFRTGNPDTEFILSNFYDGQEVVDYLLSEKQEIHLVLLDQRMPGKSGSETCNLIRQSYSATPDQQPIIVLQTAESPEHAQSNASFDLVISKPLSREKLRAVFQKYYNASIQ